MKIAIVPALVCNNDGDHMNVDNSSESSLESSSDNEAIEIDKSSTDENSQSDSVEETMEHATVQMVVMDDIVFSPKHCAFEGYTADLNNYQTGVFCTY